MGVGLSSAVSCAELTCLLCCVQDDKLQTVYSVLLIFGFHGGVSEWANVVGPNPNHVKTGSSACCAIHSETVRTASLQTH